MPQPPKDEAPKRPRGRPRLAIDRNAVADAVAALFAEGGYEAVSVVDTADKLGVSRATLYRTVSTKEDLLGILFERSTNDLTQRATALIASIDDPAERLTAMIRLQAEAAVNMRSYLGVFFGGVGVPADVYARWHSWSRQYEKLWVGVVSDNMETGYLDNGNPVVTARLILGMMIWVSRWYRPREKISIEEIAETATHLVRMGHPAPPTRSTSTRKRARGQR
ncbi:TetR/AcrR family transcriptional regulator [Mycolicibacterium sp. CH28]|uniref:TetR/AcrR family transcriptional regulator n=1 Tax=Mycolicibacterium sp. CH28 TaxID=2512237 RepID=UPI001081EC69|nr:TetR/AcrR family transcriptional regulator [Mycolicibacterium sp. CH28]TGD87535.1 TetR/AcrR family transcriptional regulator [Mycolicibacterium sp. CH28]